MSRRPTSSVPAPATGDAAADADSARPVSRLSLAAGAAGRRSSKTPCIIPRGTRCITACRFSNLAHGQLHYDEEFQLAALLHDVGKAIEPRDPVAAGLEALVGPYHAAHGLADRASTARRGPARRQPGRPLPPPAGGERELRRFDAAPRLRPPRPRLRRGRAGVGRSARARARVGPAVRRRIAIAAVGKNQPLAASARAVQSADTVIRCRLFVFRSASCR